MLWCSLTVGAKGLVHSVEKIPENHMKAQRSFYRWADSYDKLHATDPWPRNVTFFHSALADFQSHIQYDMVLRHSFIHVIFYDACVILTSILYQYPIIILSVPHVMFLILESIYQGCTHKMFAKLQQCCLQFEFFSHKMDTKHLTKLGQETITET